VLIEFAASSTSLSGRNRIFGGEFGMFCQKAIFWDFRTYLADAYAGNPSIED
jgi:hypothetical protein